MVQAVCSKSSNHSAFPKDKTAHGSQQSCADVQFSQKNKLRVLGALILSLILSCFSFISKGEKKREQSSERLQSNGYQLIFHLPVEVFVFLK